MHSSVASQTEVMKQKAMHPAVPRNTETTKQKVVHPAVPRDTNAKKSIRCQLTKSYYLILELGLFTYDLQLS